MNPLSALSFLVLSALPGPEESLCAPEMSTIGDAWKAVEGERRRIPVLLECNELLECSNRLAALLSHLKFILRRADSLPGDVKKVVANAVEVVRLEREEALSAALRLDAAGVGNIWEEVQPHLRLLEAAVAGTVTAEGSRAPVPMGVASFGIRLTQVTETPEGATEYGFKLTGATPGRPASGGLTEQGPMRLHVLMANQSLTDFHHVIAVEKGGANRWAVQLRASTSEPYRAWILGESTGNLRREYGVTNLTQTGIPLEFPDSERVEQLEWSSRWGQAVLKLPESPLEAGMPSRLQVKFRAQPDGAAVPGEPPITGWMLRQVTAISEDLLTVVHTHPKQSGDAASREEGGSRFFFEAPRGGFYRIFLTLGTGAGEVCCRFGIRVSDARR